MPFLNIFKYKRVIEEDEKEVPAPITRRRAIFLKTKLNRDMIARAVKEESLIMTKIVHIGCPLEVKVGKVKAYECSCCDQVNLSRVTEEDLKDTETYLLVEKALLGNKKVVDTFFRKN